MHLPRTALLAAVLAVPAPAFADTLPQPGPSLLEVRRDDHRLDRFAADLGRNLRGVWQGSTLGPLALGGAFAFASSSADGAAIRYFDRNPMGRFGRVGEVAGSGQVMAAVTGGFLLAGQLAPEGRFRAATYDMAQAGIVNAAYTYAIKKSVGRERPNAKNDLSFPSGHTSNAVAAATVWAHHYPKAAVPVYAAAGLIGASRVARGAHHISDVLAGATIGYVVGRTVVRGPRALGDGGAQLSVAADGGPSGDGMGLSLAVGF